MFEIDARLGLWTIKHLVPTCGASFQMTGDKIIDNESERIAIICPNCGIQLNMSSLKDAVINLSHCQESLERASKKNNDPSIQSWQIDPPIKVVEKEKTSIIRMN